MQILKSVKSSQEEMMSTICAIRAELETIQHEMKAVIQPIRAELDETTACNGATETEPVPGMIHFIEEHQEILKGKVADPRKRRGVCSLAAERSQKRKERTRGNSGSRRKSAAACRRLSRRADVP
jgi:hypothetical protein